MVLRKFTKKLLINGGESNLQRPGDTAYKLKPVKGYK